MRKIEKRLIVKLKAKNPAPLDDLEFLMMETFNDINEEADKLGTVRCQLLKTQNELSCILKLLKNLLSLMDINHKTKEILMATFCDNVDDLEGQVGILEFNGKIITL